MFWLRAEKLKGDSLVESVKMLQDTNTSRKDKNKAFEDLRETFGGLIGNKIKSIGNIATNANERKEIRHHIETSFLEVLMDLTPKSAADIVGYIAHAFNTKINVHSIKNLLGKGEIVSDINKYKIRFKNALRTFHDKYKKMPEFNKVDIDELESDDNDVKKFSEIIKMPEEKVLEILKLFGQGTIKSMFDDVGSDGSENALILMDTLKSDEPLPDKVLNDREIMRLFEKEIKKLPENQQKVLTMYYHPSDPNAGKITSDQIAQELKKEDPSFTERMVRHWIAIGREKLRESPELKELYTAGMIKKLVKLAMTRYNTTENIVFEIVSKFRK